MSVNAMDCIKNETQQSVSDWAEETFGRVASSLRVAARVNEELAELIRAVTAEMSSEEAVEEGADVLIVLFRLGSLLAVNLQPLALSAYSSSSVIEYALGAHREMHRLMETLLRGKNPEEALRSVWRKVNELIWRAHGVPQLAINEKMAKNRSRVWKQDGTGHGYHVRNKELAS